MPMALLSSSAYCGSQVEMMALAMATMPTIEVFQFLSRERKKFFMTVEWHCQSLRGT